MAYDPVCNMEVDEATAISVECEGKLYYFCSEKCRDEFLRGKTCENIRRSYDLIIIGGGPAGLTAAVYAAILKTDAFLVAKELGGQAIDSTRIKNYMGYDFITGPELIKKFEHQLFYSNYIYHRVSEVEKIERRDGCFTITTSDLTEYHAKAVIMASGMTRRKLDVPGEEEFQRKGVFYGNIQDYSFAHDKDVAVIGGGNSALQIVDILHGIARTVHLVSDFELSADPSDVARLDGYGNVKKYELYTVERFEGNDSLSHVLIRKKASAETVRLDVEGAFIAIGLQPNSGLTIGLADHNDKEEIRIAPDCSTSCPGLFAAGDVTDAFGKRIIIASGEGAKAAMAARKYLLAHREKACADN